MVSFSSITDNKLGSIEIGHVYYVIESVTNTFSSMLGIDPIPHEINRKNNDRLERNELVVTGIIGLAGEISGSIVLNFDHETAQTAIGKFMGCQYDHICPDVIDGIGELTNIVAGDAKNRLAAKGYKFNIGLPTVISGKSFATSQTKGEVCLVIDFTSSAGPFSLEVCLKVPESLL